jgi:biopolymer transport protein ExbB
MLRQNRSAAVTFGDILFLFLNPFEAMRGVRDFLELGGNVLVLIMGVTLLLWALIYERYGFFRGAFQNLVAKRHAEWQARQERQSRTAYRIRTMMISDARLKAHANLSYIKTLVALAPFLGLLGTVTGMVEVFDVMAITGSGNARAMAAGISKATLPTMAGMVVALSGVFFINSLERKAKRAIAHLEDGLTLSDERQTPKAS